MRAGKWKLRNGELYDLRADIAESKNLAKQHPDVVRRLSAMMKEFDAKLKADSRPIGKAPGGKPKPKRKPKSKAKQ